MSPRIILASQSPSRLMVLRSAGFDPTPIPSHTDERALQARLESYGVPPVSIVQALATAKAAPIGTDHPGDVVIGGDSMLLIDGTLYGKPHTPDATVQRWRAQRGKTAQLLTGHCIVYGRRRYVETSTTTITFARPSMADITAYAESGEPLGCAGAFTLEGLGGWFIDRIEGDSSGVIGLSLPVVRRALYDFGLDVSDFWNS